MQSSIAQAGDRRRLSDGRASLPWLSQKMPGEFEPIEGAGPPPHTVSKEDDLNALSVPSGGDPLAQRQDSDPNLTKPISDLRRVVEPSKLRRASSIAMRSGALLEAGDGDLSPMTIPSKDSRLPSEHERKLSQAVTDLERLMREAVQVAIQAAALGQTNDLNDVLRGATDNIHRASVESPFTMAQPLKADSDSEDEAPRRQNKDDSAVEVQMRPVHVTVERPPDLPSPSRAELVDASRTSTPSRFYRPEEDNTPRVPERMTSASASRKDRVQTADWSVIPARKSTVPGLGNTPWTPRRTNTALDNYQPTSPRRPRTDALFDVKEDDFFKTRREKRHYRNLDPATKGLSLRHKPHFSLRTQQGFSFGHHTRHHPIARKWSSLRKRLTATAACINTGFAGYVIGVYAGEVPRIQYQVVDPNHYIILGNVMLFIGLATTTFLFWPLPLLHGRKPYTLGAFALVLPLQFPQAVVVSSVRPPNDRSFRVGLLLARLLTGLALGLANINFVTTLLDLFGASLQSSNPHQELVILDDVRRQGGGMGIWLGIWSWCFVGSIALGFLTGAGIIAHLNPQWGFYITCMIGVPVLLLNVMVPETRRSPYRRSFTEFVDEEERVRRRIARGEVKLHLETEGPIWWGQEVWAGIKLNFKMLFQWGFFILAAYLGWTYALVVLVIVLLGSLLSREYHWSPQFVGIGVFSIGIGALLAIPVSKAGLFSKERTRGPRTDSMTFERQVTRSSHMVRRVIFMLVLPLAGIAYTFSSPGGTVHWILPLLFAGFIGFLANLGIAECIGVVMETFDTSDLQPGVNSRHRLKSMASSARRRRTNYSSFPRVTAGIFVSQTIGFLLAAAATGVGGVMTRTLGSQTATAITAAVLMVLTILLTAVLWRFRHVQVIPKHAFGTRRGTFEWGEKETDEYWKPVVIGNPSGKTRRMNVLELGKMSRWTEIRILNKLIRPDRTGPRRAET